MTDPIYTAPPVPQLPEQPKAKKKSFIRRTWPYALTAVIALIIGSAIGGSGRSEASSAAPAPAKTVEVVKEVAAEVDDTQLKLCQGVANDLWYMVQDFNSDVAMPYSDALQIIVNEAMSAYPDASEVDRATALVQGAGTTVQSFTAQINSGLGDDFQTCVN